MLQPRVSIAREGDVVIAYQGHENLTPVRLKRGEMFHCKSGKFYHHDIIGKPLGTYIAGTSNRLNDPHRPYLLFLQLSASLWTQSVPHRTQIIYDTDIAVIILQLRLGPGKRVVEAGTGSGSLTHAMAKVVAPTGTVFTCDFHKARCLQAREEFQQHFGLDNTLVSSQWRDVCTTSTDVDVTWSTVEGGETPSSSGSTHDLQPALRIHNAIQLEEQTEPRTGFGVPPKSVDAVFLDVPAPWLAVENVLHVLKPGGILATFSPCIEQTQRLCARLREGPDYEFVDIRTVEALTKYFEPCAPALPASVAGVKRQRVGEEEGNESSSSDRQRTNRTKLRACPVSKGHSAYLTFARRRLPPDQNLVEVEADE